MAYNEGLADDVRASLSKHSSVTERKMFGGIAFMVDGNMAVGVTGDDLMVRIGKERHDDALRLRGAQPMSMGDRPMRGWVRVGATGIDTDQALESWIERGVAHARSLPPK